MWLWVRKGVSRGGKLVYDAAGNVGQIPALLWVSVFPNYKWDNNSYFGKVREFISPGESCSHRRNGLKTRWMGEGAETAGSCEGLTVSMVTRGSLERRRGLGTGCRRVWNWRFHKESSPFSQEKGLLRDRALHWDRPLRRVHSGVLPRVIDTRRTGPQIGRESLQQVTGKGRHSWPLIRSLVCTGMLFL